MKLAIRQNRACFGSCEGCRAAGADRCPLIEAGRLFHSFGAGIVRKPKTRSASFFCYKTSGRGSLLQFAAGALVNLHFGKCAFIEPPPERVIWIYPRITNEPRLWELSFPSKAVKRAYLLRSRWWCYYLLCPWREGEGDLQWRWWFANTRWLSRFGNYFTVSFLWTVVSVSYICKILQKEQAFLVRGRLINFTDEILPSCPILNASSESNCKSNQ